MKKSFEVISSIKFINVEVNIEVQSFKCIAEVQLVVGEGSELLDREFIDYRKGQFMGLPIDDFRTFRTNMQDNFGVNVNKLIKDQVEVVLSDSVCKKIIAENKF